MFYQRILVLFLMVAVGGLAMADTCGNCEKAVAADVEFCHWCGKPIEDAEIASSTRTGFGSRTFRACGQLWKAMDDADTAFDDAHLWIKSLGPGWRCPTKEELKALVESGARLPFKRYPDISVIFGEPIESFPEPIGKAISFTSGEEHSCSANSVEIDARALAVYSR